MPDVHRRTSDADGGSDGETRAEPAGAVAGASGGREQAGRPVGTKLWVVPASAADCPHLTAQLEEIGFDGRNGYWTCGRCGAVLVFQDQLGLTAHGRRNR